MGTKEGLTRHDDGPRARARHTSYLSPQDKLSALFSQMAAKEGMN